MDVLEPTIREEGSQIIYTFNRQYEDDPVFVRHCAEPDPRKWVRKINMDENPFVSRALQEEADALKKRDPDEWAHIYGGEPLKAEGAYFGAFRRDRHVIPQGPLDQDEWYRWYGFDWGMNAPFALVKVAINHRGKIIQYGEWYGGTKSNVGIGMGSAEVAKEVRKMMLSEGVSEIYCDPAMWGKANSYNTPAEDFIEAGIYPSKAINDRVPGWNMLQQLLVTQGDDGEPMFQMFDTCVHTAWTFPRMIRNARKPDDMDSAQDDHLLDALRYAIMTRRKEHYTQNQKEPEHWTSMDDW
jgi:hypothetical protein